MICPHCQGHWNCTCGCASCGTVNPPFLGLNKGICKVCNGRGQVPDIPNAEVCPHCRGHWGNACTCPSCRVVVENRVMEGICKVCNGVGLVPKMSFIAKLRINILGCKHVLKK